MPNDAGTESDTKTPDYAPKEYKVIPGSEIHAADEIKAPEKAEKSYTIKSGDNLSDIAQEQLGDANRWKEIYELNKDVIGDNPDLIHPGKKLKLPE
jgi:nucleoid-associated protein YgaU